MNKFKHLYVILSLLFTTKVFGESKKVSFYSEALEIQKELWVYLPDGHEFMEEKLPTVYLFRGHEDEWFNRYSDPHRQGRAIQDMIDDLLSKNLIRPAIFIGVGMTSKDGRTTSLGMNMQFPHLSDSQEGLGTGRFADYFRNDVIPFIQKSFNASDDPKLRYAAGFSLGGFMANYLAIKHPGLFAAVATYDATMMFPELNDPTEQGGLDDLLWIRNDSMFSPVFGPHWERISLINMFRENPINLLSKVGANDLGLLKQTKFYITAAARRGPGGNYLRNWYFQYFLSTLDINNLAPNLELNTSARHNWYWADTHIKRTLLSILKKKEPMSKRD